MDNKPARDAQGRLLPGNSANPMGRPKLPDWFKSRGPDALRVLLAQATGEIIPCDDGTVLPAVQQVATESTTKDRKEAAAIMADRIYGKAPDVISGDPDNPIAAAIRVEFIKP